MTGKSHVRPISSFSLRFLSIIPADPVQQNLYAWEPLADDESVPSVPLSAIEETDNSDDGYFEQSQSEPDLLSTTPYTGDLCAREVSTSETGAMCSYEPQCDNGRLAMCCSKMTLYGRPTECTRCLSTLINVPMETKNNTSSTDNPLAFKCTSGQGEHVYCCRPGFIVSIYNFSTSSSSFFARPPKTSMLRCFLRCIR